MKKVLRRLTVTKPRYLNTIAIDVETEPESGKFVLAAYYGLIKIRKEREEVSGVCYSQDDLVSFIQSLEEQLIRRNGTKKRVTGLNLVFHNADFDIKYISSIINWDSLIFSNSRIVTGKTKNGSKIFDTMNFVRASLEDLIKAFDLGKYGVEKLGFDRLEERCRMDAKATWLLFDYLQRFFIDTYGITIKPTLPSCALAVYRKNYFSSYWERDNDEMDIFEREAYHGGRTECYIRGEVEYDSYDVNSMYPAVMREFYPKPDSGYWEYNPTPAKVMRRLEESKLFIADVDMFIPDMLIPPLPVKRDKLIFPCGDISGVYTSVEIKTAIEYGAVLKNVRKMLTYSQKEKYLERYADDMYERRKKAKETGNKPLSEMYKLLMNSLYGKFGERRGQERNFIPVTIDYDVKEGERLVMMGDQWYKVIEKQEKKDTEHSFTAIAAFVTAYARAKLFRAMKDTGESRVIYCDTDSIKVLKGTRPGFEVNPLSLGAFKYEGSGTARFYKPKMYSDKMKGVPKRHALLEETDSYIRVGYEKVIKRKEAIIRGLEWNAFVKVEKVVQKEDDKRTWRGNRSVPIGYSWLGHIDEGNIFGNAFPGEQYDRGNTTIRSKRGTERRKEKGA